MSFKIRSDVNAIPSRFVNGAFISNLGESEYRIEIPVLKNLVFEEQCNQFVCNNVMAYLTNDEYGLVLRYDSTGCLYLLRDKTLIISFTFEYESVDIQGIYPCGVFRNDSRVDFIVSAVKISPKYYIITCDCPWSILTTVEENSEYFNTPFFGKAVGGPLIVKRKGDLYIADVAMSTKLLDKLGGLVNISDGYLALGGAL